MTIRAHRVVAAGALAVAAVAAPIAISLSSGNAAQSVAGPACLAWYGNREDGVCLSYSNGNGVNVGTPDLGVYGPNSGSLPGGGIGVSTGPLLPGQTWNVPIGGGGG
jgi:hypothetical protein